MYLVDIQKVFCFPEFNNRTVVKKNIGLPYFCWVSPTSIDDERARLLEESGCKTLEMGVQTTCDAHLMEITNRRRQTITAPDALKKLGKTGIFVVTDNLVGLPGSTTEDIKRLVRFYLKYPADQLSVYWLKYFPRTQILDTAIEKGLLTEHDREQIEKGMKIGHYRRPAHSFPEEYKRYCELLLLANVLPKPLIRRLLAKKHRLWLVPTVGFYRFSMIYLSLKKTIFERKLRIHNYYTPPRYAVYYLTQTIKAVFGKVLSFPFRKTPRLVPAFLRKAYQNLVL